MNRVIYLILGMKKEITLHASVFTMPFVLATVLAECPSKTYLPKDAI